MSTRTTTTTGFALLCALAGLILSTATTTALAGAAHKYLSQITETPAEPGVAEPGQFMVVRGLAFGSGLLYVGDDRTTEPTRGIFDKKATLDEYGGNNSFVKQIPGAGVISSGGPNTIAVNDATGEIYVGSNTITPAETTTGVVDVLNAEGGLVADWLGEDTPIGAFGSESVFVAFDNSTNHVADPAAGDLYVSSTNHGAVYVLRSEADGKEKYVSELTGPPGNGGWHPYGVTVNEQSGDIAVVNSTGIGATVDVFRPTAASTYEFLFEISKAPGAPVFAEVKYVATDSKDGDIYIAVGAGAEDGAGVLQFSSTGSYLGEIQGTPNGPFAGLAGITVAPTGDLYVADQGQRSTNHGTKIVDVFGPSFTVPSVTTGASTKVRGRGVTLNGSVNPSGLEVTSCEFEYGLTRSYGSTAVCSPLPKSGTSTLPVDADLSELTPGATYYYRLSTTDGEGETTKGATGVLTMPLPQAVAAGPSNVGGTSATLHATVENPMEVAIETCQFEYGATSLFGSTVPCSPAPGSATGPVQVSADVTGLSVDNLAHYRLALTPTGGEPVYSTEETLITSPVVQSSALASNITSFAATVSGVLEAGEITPAYHFVYGTTPAYGSRWPQTDALAGTQGQQPVAQRLTGLQPDTTYHYALVATNFAGGQSVGPDETFTTRPLVPPAVGTGGSEAVGQTTATLTGSVNPEGLPTTYYFEYGPTTAYGSTWPLVQVFAGTGSTAQGVAVAVPGLQPGSGYHYRLVATNEDGTTYGADESFVTPAYPVSMVQEPVTLPVLKAAPAKSTKPAAKHRATKKKKKVKSRKKSKKSKKGKRG